MSFVSKDAEDSEGAAASVDAASWCAPFGAPPPFFFKGGTQNWRGCWNAKTRMQRIAGTSHPAFAMAGVTTRSGAGAPHSEFVPSAQIAVRFAKRRRETAMPRLAANLGHL